MEKNTTKSITEETEYSIDDLKRMLSEYETHANSPYNDGWTRQGYKEQADKIREKLQQLNG